MENWQLEASAHLQNAVSKNDSLYGNLVALESTLRNINRTGNLVVAVDMLKMLTSELGSELRNVDRAVRSEGRGRL